MAVPDELKVGMKNLARSMSAMDAERSFDRCSVGKEGCKQPSIDAHCIPRTSLGLIANQQKKVVGFDAEPPKTPGHWIEGQPIGEHGIGKFNVGRWACAEHDRLFSPIDSTCVDVQDDHSLFLLLYRTTAYLTQKVLHASSRLAMPILDPAIDTPAGLPQKVIEGMKGTAVEMSGIAARLLFLKWQTDKMWLRKTYSEFEYRVVMWETVPTMAATGMRWVKGPDDGVEWYGRNSIVPVWLILLPQEHGQTIVTASPKGLGAYAHTIHEGMPKSKRNFDKKGNNWTRLTCRKVLENASVIALSHDRFSQTSYAECNNLQSFIFERNWPDAPKRKLPNLLNIR